MVRWPFHRRRKPPPAAPPTPAEQRARAAMEELRQAIAARRDADARRLARSGLIERDMFPERHP